MNHIGDDDFDAPLVVNKSAVSEVTFNQESIIMVTSMGFTENQAKKALSSKRHSLVIFILFFFIETSGNVEAAIEWIFNNPDESLMPIETPKQESSSSANTYGGSDSSKYELVAFIRMVFLTEEKSRSSKVIFRKSVIFGERDVRGTRFRVFSTVISAF